MGSAVSKFARFAFILAVMVAFCAGTVWAQGGGSGDLNGIVFDPSGAVVAGAKVQLTNKLTGVVRNTDTTTAGVYRFVALPVVGTYTLKLEVSGFKTAEIGDIVISVGRIITQDVHLELGRAAETVTVEAGVQLVQPTESQVSDLVDRRVWQALPLESRNSNTFLNNLPGTVPNQFSGTTRGAAISGSRPGTGNFMVEGYDNNDQGQGGRGANVGGVANGGAITDISPEAIQEYRVISHDYAAEYGKGGGFVTDSVLKSGTNSLHGSIFEYNRIQALAANSFFSNREGIKDRLVRNQFGGSIGGPIVKDKTFFYGSIEIHRRREASPLTATATTQQFLDFVQSGAFATFMESNPNGVCMVNNGAPCPGAFSHSRTLGPIFSNLLKTQFFPVGTKNFSNVGSGPPYTDGIVYPVPIYGDVTVSDRTTLNQNRFSIKIDHRLGPKDTINSAFLFDDSDEFSNHDGADTTIGGPIIDPGRSINFGITHTHTFSPTVINQFRASYLRHRRDFPQVAGSEGIPSIVTAFDPIGVGLGLTSNLPQFFTDNQFQFQDHLSWVRGKHSMKAGAEYRRIRNGSAFEAVKNGLFEPYGIEDLATDGFFGDEADRVISGGPTFGSWALAQASVDPTTSRQPQYYRGYRENEVAAYIQDDWRIHPRFTVNIGLRWEYFGPPHNFRPGLDSNFYFGTVVLPVQTTSANLFFPRTNALASMVATGAFQQRDHDIWNKDLNNFAPRFGFAWDVTGKSKTILRAGYGIFYDRMWNNLFENIRFNAPFFAFNTVGTFGNGVPVGALSAPGLFGVPFTEANTALFNSKTLLPSPPVPSPRHMDQNMVTAYSQQFYMGVQWEFAKDFVLETDYIGTLGNKLTGVIDINTFNGRTRGGGTRRINPNIAGDNFRTNAFRSNYHGLQVVVRKRFAHGLQFNANYTWSHALDTVSDAFNGGHQNIFRPTDNFDIKRDYGNADFDIRHRFVLTFYYDLPLWTKSKLLGGWSVSGIVTTQTGVPVTLYDGSSRGDANADGYNTDRPIYKGAGNINSSVTGQSPADGYFDASQFRRIASNGSDCGPGNGVFISATRWWCDSPTGRGVLTGPGFANVDFSVAKKFKLTERWVVQFQANFFNLFNHPNFAIPTGNFASSSFGRSTSTLGTPRITQLALRIDF